MLLFQKGISNNVGTELSLCIPLGKKQVGLAHPGVCQDFGASQGNMVQTLTTVFLR